MTNKRFESKPEQEITMKYLDIALSGYVDSVKFYQLQTSERAVRSLETLLGLDPEQEDRVKELREQQRKASNVTTSKEKELYRDILIQRIDIVMERISEGFSDQKPFIR